ncbi:AbiJ-NTD4 domain-containing protein [Dyella terrae]|uniref:AbiJ-NTD4 domain-containing protein n=1 Tax=Dyella terrae TaxID=522259 RepID=UPI001EFDC1F6|nr:hypothetical protein [Dyella terrae]ULU27847.1 AbiJ N-terminal domain 4 [Dyella terrae]
MARFSERNGFVKPRDLIQIHSMDDDLRNGLWNVLYLHYWGNPRFDHLVDPHSASSMTRSAQLGRQLWLHYFKRPVAEAPRSNLGLREFMSEWYKAAPWHQVFDLIEFLLDTGMAVRADVESDLKFILERERSGYRLVSGQFVKITDEQQLQSVEDAAGSPFKSAAAHIQQAVQLYANRKAPDYRNVVKESISAVESVARMLTGKDDLAPALAELEKKHQLHAVLKQGFIKLYSYTNGEDGIRHAMLDDNVEVTEADARYMLITCSTFLNYLVSRFGS